MLFSNTFVWALLLGATDAELRVLRRDRNVCSMEIVATVTRTYTVTSSEEVVVPCETQAHGSKPDTKPLPPADDVAPTVEASSTRTANPSSTADSPQPKDDKPDGHFASELPFETLIPSDYFPDITIKDPPAVATSSETSSTTHEDAVSSATTSSAEPSDASDTDCSVDCTSQTSIEAADPVTPLPEPTSSVNTESAASSEPTPGSEPTEDDDEPTEDDDEPTEDDDEPTEDDDEPSEDEDTDEPSESDNSSNGSEPSPTETDAPAATDDDEDSSAEESTSTSFISTTSITPSTSSTTEVVEPTTSSHPRHFPADIVDKLQDESMEKLKEHLKRNPASGCTLENAAVRREWGDLSIPERQDYLEAVQCLQSKPPRTPSNIAAGAKSRYDDFIVTHIQQTNTIHNTANFLAWHRYFTWAYETALRDECGYKGYQPYWNWDRYANDPVNSPIFNGNATSFGGSSVNNNCAAPGYFDELNVNLGPGNSLRFNPRCLKRSVSRNFAQQCTADKTMSVLNEQSIERFQDHMQIREGIHAGGHFTMGGDPGGDVFTSPGDPVFYLHHAMIDRVWWIWQLQDLDSRLKAVGGRVGGGSGRRGSLDDEVTLGFVTENAVLGELLDTMGGKGGEFCYIYV